MKLSKVHNLKTLTLLDNMVYINGPLAHWGYSILISYSDKENVTRNVLLDTGSDVETFLKNAKFFKIDFTQLDALVLSHGHLDHVAATIQVAQTSHKLKLHAHPSAFNARYSIDEYGKIIRPSISIVEKVKELKKTTAEILCSKSPIEVTTGLWTTGEVPRKSFETIAELGRSKRIIIEEGVEKEDLILDDQSIFLDLENFGIIVFTGCAHSGLLNTLEYVEELTGKKPKAVIGGTHLTGRKPDYLIKTIEGLRKYDLKLLSPGHCTGFNAIHKLASEFPHVFELNYVGKTFDFNEIIKKQSLNPF